VFRSGAANACVLSVSSGSVCVRGGRAVAMPSDQNHQRHWHSLC
jgi:hypothetical protein